LDVLGIDIGTGAMLNGDIICSVVFDVPGV